MILLYRQLIMTYEPITGPKLLLLTITLSLGIFMNVLDSSIANVAIPYIAGGLAVSPDQGTWVITSFTVSTAILLPCTGWLAKRLGEVRLFILATFIFTVMSFLCGLASNLPELILFRVFQGAAAGPMIPLSQSLLLSNYPDDKKGLANSLWAMTAVVAPLSGPILGGWLTYDYSWPWIFFINVPVGLFCCWMTQRLLGHRDTPIIKVPADYVGMLLLAIGVGCLQLLLDNGQDLDWFGSNIIITLAIISCVSLCYFIVWELTGKHPIVDLTLFKIRNFGIGTIAIGLGYMAFFSNVVIVPLWLQTQMGYTAIWAGFALAPMGIIPVLLTLYVGRRMNRLNLRIMISFGFLVFSVTSFWYTLFDTNTSFNALVWPRFFMGLGITCFFPPLLTVITSGLPPDRMASALGLFNFIRIVGGSFGVSLSVTLWERRASFHNSRLVESINPFNIIFNDYFQRLKDFGFIRHAAYEQMANTVTNQAFMMATNDFFWLSGWIFMFLLVVIWFAKPPFFNRAS